MKIKFSSRADRIFYKLDRYNKLVEQEYKCYYCGCVLTRTTVTTDHIIPLSKTDRWHNSHNTVASCESCNSRKSDKIIVEDPFDVLLKEMSKRLEERIKLAEWKLSFNGKGSFKKWKKFNKKK